MRWLDWRVLTGGVLALGAFVLALVATQNAAALRVIFDGHRVWHRYYAASSSMLPTLAPSDQLVPRAAQPTDLTRGTVVIFRTPEAVRIDRIVAVGGDRVAMRAGHVVLNGRPVAQQRLRPGPTLPDFGATTIWRERLPDEAHAHRLLDVGSTPQDEVAERTIPHGKLFVLGDNRDASADSRFAATEGGTDLISVEDVIGIVDTLLWPVDGRDVARPIDRGSADRPR